MARGGTPRPSEVLAERIRASAQEQEAPRIVVLIDGRSGAGKTTLAAELAAELDAQHVAMDAFYPGWGGLEVGSAMIPAVLAAEDAGYRRWDWDLAQPQEWVPVDPARAIIVEGAGSLSRRNRELATFGLWIRLDQDERKRRALARDGDGYLEHWDRWAVQEQTFLLRERPDTLADALMHGLTGELLFRADVS